MYSLISLKLKATQIEYQLNIRIHHNISAYNYQETSTRFLIPHYGT